jgi:hypothetical protein
LRALVAATKPLVETLPSDEREAGVFLSGMVWAVVVFWALAIASSLLLGRTP